MSLKLFKSIYNKVKKESRDILFSEKSRLKPHGEVRIWENEKTDENLLVEDKNLIVDSFFDIIVGTFTQDSNKYISQLSLGSGGIINGVLQTPNVGDTTLYTPVFTKTSYESVTVEKILENYISYNFRILKTEANGTGASVINEMGLLSTDGTMFARKTFQEIVKTAEKELYVEWRLVW